MCSKGFQVAVLLMIVGLSLCDDGEFYPRMPVIPPARRPPPEEFNNNPGGGFMNSGFMNTARNFVVSPTGQMAVSMAKELISRSYGGNQVLSLNLTSLLILVMLKALIFTTGLLGAGNWSQFGRGRGLEGSKLIRHSHQSQVYQELYFSNKDSIVDNAEMQLFLGFLAAEGSRNDGCLYRAVCMAPEQGAEYLKAGQALLEGFGAFDP